MGDRYWIKGTQLGMLLAYTKEGGMHNEAMELGDEIQDKQFIKNIDSPQTNQSVQQDRGDALANGSSIADESSEVKTEDTKGCGIQWGNFICDGITYNCGRCDESTTSDLLNDAFEIKWKNYLENHKLPNDAWIKELARNFFKRAVEDTKSERKTEREGIDNFYDSYLNQSEGVTEKSKDELIKEVRKFVKLVKDKFYRNDNVYYPAHFAERMLEEAYQQYRIIQDSNQAVEDKKGVST